MIQINIIWPMLNKQAWLIIYRVFAVGKVRQQIHIPGRLEEVRRTFPKSAANTPSLSKHIVNVISAATCRATQ